MALSRKAKRSVAALNRKVRAARACLTGRSSRDARAGLIDDEGFVDLEELLSFAQAYNMLSKSSQATLVSLLDGAYEEIDLTNLLEVSRYLGGFHDDLDDAITQAEKVLEASDEVDAPLYGRRDRRRRRRPFDFMD